MELSRLCIPYTPFDSELHSSKVSIVSNAGVHLKEQEPFNTDGDTSFRIIPWDVDSSRLKITHTHYEHVDGDRDINVVFPIDRLKELVKERVLGGVTETLISMGFTQAFRELRDKTVPAIAEEIRKNKADIILMTAG